MAVDVDIDVEVLKSEIKKTYASVSEQREPGQLTMSGQRTLRREFANWFTWSAFAPASRSAPERRTAASRIASPHRVRIAEARYGSARSAG